MNSLVDKLSSLVGKLLKGVAFVLGLLNHVDRVRVLLVKAGDFLDNYKMDDSFKG